MDVKGDDFFKDHDSNFSKDLEESFSKHRTPVNQELNDSAAKLFASDGGPEE